MRGSAISFTPDHRPTPANHTGAGSLKATSKNWNSPPSGLNAESAQKANISEGMSL